MKLIKETALYQEGAVQDVSDRADNAQTTADTAKSIATDTAQYYWTSSDGTDNGAHITEIPKEQFESSPSGGNLLATSNGIAVRDGLTERAQFGETVVLGETTNTHQELDYHSMKLIDKEGNTYFYVSDLRDEDGNATITDTFLGDGSTTQFNVALSVSSVTSVTIDGTATTAYGRSDTTFTFTTAPSNGSTIEITYVTQSVSAKAYTLGMRGDGNVGGISTAIGYGNVAGGFNCVAQGYNTNAVGYASHAEGIETISSGHYSHGEGGRTVASGLASHAEGVSTTASDDGSHAEGNYTTASGYSSHAEGDDTTASGWASHAEGNYTTSSGVGSHAEGDGTTASGFGSHAEGDSANASGYGSHAQNYYTGALSKYQTAIGKYNVADANDTYGFIMGNGTANNARSNALAVKWNGLIEAENSLCYGECTDSASTVAKSVTIANPSFTLQTGATIAVKFTNANSATSPTLNVNSTGDVAIKRYGTTAVGTSASASWNAGSICALMYDGTYWQMLNWDNTTYSSMTEAEIDAGTSTSTRVITPARLKYALDNKSSVGFKTFYINTTAQTITIGNAYRGVMYVLESATARCGQYIIGTTNAGVVNVAPVLATSNMTINTSTNGKVTLNTSSGSSTVVFMTAGGDTPA